MATGSFKLPISSGGSTDWVRPSDWLPMPTGITSANDTFVGLHAVFPEGNNFCALKITTSTGQYRVDWGDGTIDLVNSNVQAQHEYDYATYDPSNTTLCSRGYKQAFVTVTAVSGNIATATFQVRYVSSPVQLTTYSSGFLDCIISFPNLTNGTSSVFGGGSIFHSFCERLDIKTLGNLFQYAFLFQNCLALQSIPLFNTINATNFTSTFNNCRSLKTIPLFNTQNVTTFGSAFNGCISLQSVPLFNTIAATNMQSMFNTCNVLRTVPLFNTVSVTNMSNMFAGCTSLQSVPLFNTTAVNNFGNMFQTCLTLNYVPTFLTTSITTTSGTNFGNFVQGCASLDRCSMVFARTVSVQSCQLSRTALVEIFNNLVDRSATTSATITLNNNWGTAALTAADRLIATSKNWVIVG
jgi:hypothetical protein